MEQLREKARTQTTEMILTCLEQIGGGKVSQDMMLVRGALLDVYQEREGEEAVDAILDALGM